MGTARVALVVPEEELESQRFDEFDPWRLVAGPPRGASLDEAAVRDEYFGAGEAALPAVLAPIASSLPPSTRQLLEAFAATPFDHPLRSQRGRTISHGFHFDLGDAELPVVAAADDASEARWVPIASLVALESQLFEDHFQILEHFLSHSGGALKRWLEQ